VIEVLDATDEHLGADEIVLRAGAIVPGVHRATVYRALATLGDLGLVVHTHLGGSAAVYHLALPEAPGSGSGDSHAHLQCTRCHKVIDIGVDVVRPLVTELDRTLGFRLEPQHTALLGICADCRR
jgi:Fur family ferric uptake transcriptional regulator